MSDDISRESAIAEIKRFIGYLDEDMIERLQIAIRRIPAADARPVVMGKWEWDGHYGLYGCSNCHKCFVDQEYVKEGTWRYCPLCGADMRQRGDGS